MERRKFTREFKLEAVKLVKDRGVSYARAAEDLGVHPTQLRNWVKALADDPEHSFPGQGHAADASRATRISARRSVLAFLRATGPMAPGACGTTCLLTAYRAGCIGSND